MPAVDMLCPPVVDWVVGKFSGHLLSIQSSGGPQGPTASESSLLIHIASCAPDAAAIYSASVIDRVTMSCFRDEVMLQ